ncbi:MAG: hypothetical protein ACYTBJ_06125 [Planctomycetota bacterium]|jgi:hypothetical protein
MTEAYHKLFHHIEEIKKILGDLKHKEFVYGYTVEEVLDGIKDMVE